MKLSHLAIIAVLASMASVSVGTAQSVNSKVAPAEFPPETYRGAQYIDSRGCVYIRAGVTGNISWIPRLTRKRTHICGQTPTQVAGATSQQRARPQPQVIQLTLDEDERLAESQAQSPSRRAAGQVAAAATAQVQPKPSPLKRRAATSAAVTRTQPAQGLIPDTAPISTVAARTASPTVQAATGTAVCPEKSAVSQRHIARDSRFAFRCGPQAGGNLTAGSGAVAAAPAAKPVAIKRAKDVGRAGAVASTSLPGNTRVLPRHVAQQRANVGSFKVPKGYRPAWDDDRLNPRRAEGTLAGRDRMNLIWTSDVPRRLIDRSSGRDVTAKVALVYPFTDVATQQQELGTVTLITRNGKTLKRVARNRGIVKTAVAQSPKRKAIVASRSEPLKTAPAAKRGETLRGTRYVQVGTFGAKRNAQATAKQMKRLGLPVRIGKFERSGKTLRLVLAGPFATDASAKRALGSVRSAGFFDAFVRK